MTNQRRQVASANDKADELAKKSCAEMDDGHFAELVVGDALEMRKKIDAAIRYAAVLIAKCRTWWILRKLQLK